MNLLMFFRKFWLMIILAIALLVVAVILNDPGKMPVKKVKVTGELAHINQEKMRRAITPELSAGFFGTDIAKVQAILKDFPWVSAIEVRRVWPSTISINVTEKKPVAIWNDTGLLLPSGEVFYPNAKTMSNKLPSFRGIDSQKEKILKNFKKMNDILQGMGLNITHINVISAESWEVTLSSGTKVLFEEEHLMEQLSRFKTVYPKVIAKRRQAPEVVDMRYSHGMAVDWEH